jgi:hypothetical protein
MQWFGSNRYGEKKLYKIFQYSEPIMHKLPLIGLISGFFLSFVGLSYYYNKKKVIFYFNQSSCRLYIKNNFLSN